MTSNESDKNEEKSCCTWPKVLVIAVVLVVVGILVWQFAPIDDAIDAVLPTFNNTGNEGPSGSTPMASPTPAPSTAESERFEFMLCSSQDQDCCNGLDSICDLGVDDILYASVHNAMASFEDGFLFGPNHRYNLESALEAGYRGINLDVCNCGGVYQFCHGLCSLGSRDINEVFTNINTFMNDNPTEVVVITLQMNSNADQAVNLEELYTFATAVPGFSEKFYQHTNVTDDWPTLREVIGSNKRILAFHFAGQTCTDATPCPPGLHYYLDYATNNPWQASTLADLRETSVSCPLSSTPGVAGKTFFGMNNFVTPPSQTAARSANSLEFARNRLATCSSLNEGLDVNFVYVDFWYEGDLPQLTQEHNMALANRRQRQIRKRRLAH
eukprot:CAMPEP_0117031182 /NCGR_PEP_ID=MMETSP0472-20121206/22446_1 /TAXON_ID=693140 ORGANISM="Tiarina fusus, Strain LIS" /NCGR_SAMPLE_ID=MMETSP0472 /ASSEMBLY_ACC=CAM_ASM_000603 /LENGTH=383 /DNA_ID=CAMNT_0004739463 /DNA_START=48 /DNA_END=1199 /DNA_ORIENTATION=+